MACHQEAQETTLAQPDACYCPSTSRTVAFTDKSVLTNIVSLPTASGGSVMWLPGFVPSLTAPTSGGASTPTPPTSPSTSGGSASSNAPSPSETGSAEPSSSSPSSPDAGLSTGAKIGIGVGIGVGATLLLLALLFFGLRHRRRKQNESSALSAAGDGTGDGISPHASKAYGLAGAPDTPATTAPSELEPNVARPWSLRSELPVPGTPSSPLEMQHVAAAGGRPNGTSSSSPSPLRHSNGQAGGGDGQWRHVVELPG